MRPNLLGAPRLHYLNFLVPPRYHLSAFPLPSDPSGAPSALVSAAGEGVSKAKLSESQPIF